MFSGPTGITLSVVTKNQQEICEQMFATSIAIDVGLKHGVLILLRYRLDTYK